MADEDLRTAELAVLNDVVELDRLEERRDMAPTRESRFGYPIIRSTALAGTYPNTELVIEVAYSRDERIQTTQCFDVWDKELATRAQRELFPDCLPGVVRTNIEEWIETEAAFLTDRRE